MANSEYFNTDNNLVPVYADSNVLDGSTSPCAIYTRTDVAGASTIEAHGNGTNTNAIFALGAGPNSFGVNANATSTTGVAVFAAATGSQGNAIWATTGGANAHAIIAYSANPNGYPTIYAENTDNTASATYRYAVYGRCIGSSGSAPSGNFAGVAGEANASSGVGVKGISNAADGAGVAGYANGTGASSYGVFGSASLSGSGKGVVGIAGSSGYAGYFLGRGYFTSTLTKPAGSFLIDHPLDPENKLLRHSFVESPDMKNIYDGLDVADMNGEITVRMPDYFEALNRDFRYQLTALGDPAPNLHVKAKLTDGAFTIAGAAAGQEVSWLLTGIRKDAYAEANPMLVEEEKAPEQRGRYLQPAAYGLPPEKGVDWELIQRMTQEPMAGPSVNVPPPEAADRNP